MKCNHLFIPLLQLGMDNLLHKMHLFTHAKFNWVSQEKAPGLWYLGKTWNRAPKCRWHDEQSPMLGYDRQSYASSRFNMKMQSTQYIWGFHYRDKTISSHLIFIMEIPVLERLPLYEIWKHDPCPTPSLLNYCDLQISLGYAISCYVFQRIHLSSAGTLIARFMGPTWGPSGADKTQVAPWTLLSGILLGWPAVAWCSKIPI